MKWRMQPLLALWLLFLVLSGQISHYSLLLLTLLVHELGHVAVAKWLRVPLAQCTLTLYGGELVYKQPYWLTPTQHMLIACGGPFATICLLLLCLYMPNYFAARLIDMQLYLLLFNAIPAYPLDGGRIVYYGWMIFYGKIVFFERFLSLSCIILTIIAIAALFYLPYSLVLIALLSFLIVRNWYEWRAYKYFIAFEKIVLNRLT